MPTALVTGDILIARAWTVLDEQAAVNSYNYNVITVTGGSVTDQDVASHLDTLLFAPFYKPNMAVPAEYRGTQVYFRKRFSGSLPAPVSSTAGGGVGANGATPVPRVAAFILKYSTFVRGPSGRGRVYLPFIGSTYVAANGRPTVGADVAINSFASSLLAPVVVTVGASTATLKWGLVRKVSGITTFTGEIIQAQSADKIGQMHKRGDYGKANESPI